MEVIQIKTKNDASFIPVRLPHILSYLGIIVFFVSFCFNVSTVSLVYLLPLSYSISMRMVQRCYANRFGLSLIIIEITKFCRFVVLPLFITFEKKFQGVNIAPQYENQAVLLMIYEIISVSVVLFYIGQKKIVNHEEKSLARKIESFGWISKALIAFWFFLLFTNERLKYKLFNFSLAIKEEIIEQYTTVQHIDGVTKVFFAIGIVFLFSYILSILQKIPLDNSIKFIVSVVVCVGFVSCLWTSGTGVSRWNMLIGVILSVYALLFYFPKYRNRIIGLGGGGFIFVIVVGSFLKTISFGFDSTIESSMRMYFSSQYFDEYFQGVRSTSNCIFVALNHKYEMDPIKAVIMDYCTNVPYLIKFLGYTDHLATEYYWTTSGHYDLIIPTVTVSLMRFGEFLSPLYSCFAVFAAFYVEKKMFFEDSLTGKLIYIYIIFWFSLFMCIGPNIVDGNCWSYVIGIIILTIERNLLKTRT